MASKTLKVLPLIDFSNLNEKESPMWESARIQVRDALEEYGCFEALFVQVQFDLKKSVFDGLEQLFKLPLETKMRNRYDRPYHGYVGQVPQIPLYESLGIDDVLSHGNIDNFTNLMWLEGNPSFSKSVESFSKQLSQLDKIVRRMVVESLGLEKYMDDHIDSTDYAVRVQKYEGTQSHESKLGLLPHTDKNIITILCPNEVKGLEVLTKDGQWIKADNNSPNSFFVVAGDAFHAWTNGRVHSPHHRVMLAEDKVRYSIGLFSTPKCGSIIVAPKEMVDVDHPLLFKPFDYAKFIDYVQVCQATLCQATLVNTLKNYCGA